MVTKLGALSVYNDIYEECACVGIKHSTCGNLSTHTHTCVLLKYEQFVVLRQWNNNNDRQKLTQCRLFNM